MRRPKKRAIVKELFSNSNTDANFKLNINIVLLILGILTIGVFGQMIRWQIIEGDRFKALAQSQYLESEKQRSPRGIIYAVDGTILATDQPAWNIYASLSSIEQERESFFKEKDQYIQSVSSVLGLDPDDLKEKLSDDFRYFSLANGVDSDKKKALEEMKIFSDKSPGFGLHFEKIEKRVYPNGELASQIVGFMGKDPSGLNDLGLYGIEGYFFGDLEGTEGYTYQEQDAKGNVILTSEYEPVLPRKGKDIKLTINPSIQAKVEEVLKEGVTNHQAKSGTAILMDPKTGAIIAMANYPTFNPNEYWRVTEPWIFKNRAVADVYEPGSVFKPITVAIGLESGVIDENTVCNDTTGSIKIFEGTPDEKTIYTWDRKPDGRLTPEGYLQFSNNPCIVQTALKVGHQSYYPKMREFGIGEYVGLGLQDETNSYILPFEYWTKLDLAVTSFGQSVSTTPLQILSALSTFANNGVRMKPYVVSEVVDGDERIIYKPTVLSQPVSEETADKVANMMRSVVTGGDGHKYFQQNLGNYDIAGKTGTAQIPKQNEVGYYSDKTNTTFIGFAPVENPKLIMLVRLEQPSLDQYAANTAVPVWVEMFKSIATDLEIEPRK